MRVDELITAVRVSGALPTADPTYTDARIRDELHNALTTLFERPVVNSRQGYWRKLYDVATTTTQTRYRLPPRAVAGTAESVEVFSGSSPDPNYPVKPACTFQGDQLVFATAPSASLTLRFTYYLRPSKLVQEQSAGQVTGVDNDAHTVTVNSLPTNRVTAQTIASTNKVDIVHPNGWHEACVVDQAVTIASTTLTFASTVDLSQVEVGDFVRAADQTDWPCLPEDFHRSLADATAVAILVSKGDLQKAQALASRVSGDIERFQDLLKPRVKNSPGVVVPRYGVLRGRGFRPLGRLPG